MTEFETNYLAHHGIKGQKWGIRRFQNADGSLTSDGRKRYGIGEGRDPKEAANKQKAAARAAKAAQKAEKRAAVDRDAKENLKEYLRKHPKKMAKYGQVLSEEDAREVISKIEFDRKLRNVRDTEIQAGWKKIQDLSNNVNTVANLLNNSKNAYNTTAEIYNTLVDTGVIKNGKKWPRVGKNDQQQNPGNK
jgi:hypothetical protein